MILRLVAIYGSTEPHQDDEMNEMALPYKHRIQIANPGGLRSSSLLIGHGGSQQS